MCLVSFCSIFNFISCLYSCCVVWFDRIFGIVWVSVMGVRVFCDRNIFIVCVVFLVCSFGIVVCRCVVVCVSVLFNGRVWLIFFMVVW